MVEGQGSLAREGDTEWDFKGWWDFAETALARQRQKQSPRGTSRLGVGPLELTPQDLQSERAEPDI